MTFKVATLKEAHGVFEVLDQPMPSLARDGLIVRVELGGVCATDLHIAHGHIPGFDYPSTLGHEVCGIVEAVGPAFGEDVRGTTVRAGDRVAVMPATPCGHCSVCKSGGRYPNCEHWDVIGFSNPDVRPAGGGWGQYIALNSRARVFVSTAPADNVVLAEPAATPVEGLSRAGFRLGDSVLVQGTGTVGLLAIAAAALGGASTITAIGGPRRRLEIAREFGATTTVDVGEIRDVAERKALVLQSSPGGRGFDLVMECAGVPSAVAEGFGYLSRGGCFVELGHFSDVGAVEINPYEHFLSRDARMVSSSGYTPDSFSRALTLVEKLGSKAERLITHRLPMGRAADAINALQPSSRWRLDGTEVGKIVIDPWQES